MPYTLGNVAAKDANLVNQSIATAKGTGTSVDPFVPAHADIGLGAIDDLPATSNTADATLISLFKRLLNVTLSAIVSLLTDMDAAIGDPGDAAATNDTGNFSLISLLKRLLIKTGGATPEDYRSIRTLSGGPIKSTPGNLLSIEVVNLGTTIKWFQLYDELIGPAGLPSPPTTTPIRILPVYPNGGLLVMGKAEWGESGLEFTTAIGWVISTTPGTFVAPPATETSATARYV